MEDDGTIVMQVLGNARKATNSEFAKLHSNTAALIRMALLKLWKAMQGERTAVDMIVQQMAHRAMYAENLVTNLSKPQQDE